MTSQRTEPALDAAVEPTGFRPLAVGLLVAGVLFGGLAGLWLGHLAEEAAEERLGRELSQRLAKRLDDMTLAPALEAVPALATHPEVLAVADGSLPPDAPAVLPLLEHTRFLLGADLVYVLDAEGTTVACTPYGEDGSRTLTGNNYRFRPYFTRAQGKGRTATYAALGVTTGKRGIYLGHPLGTADDPRGVAVVKLGLARIDRVLADQPHPCALASPDGVVFASNRPDWLLHTLDPLDAATRQRLRESRQFADRPLTPLPTGQRGDDAHPEQAGRIHHPISTATLLPGWQLLLYLPEPPPNLLLLAGGALGGAFLGLLLPIGGIFVHDRRRLRRERRRQAQRLELALAGGKLGTWDWQLSTDEVHYDRRWAEMKGYDPGELAPTLETWRNLVHPDDLPETYRQLEAHFAGETPGYEATFRMRRKSGEWMWILDRGRVVERDAAGKPLRACGTHLDITPQKELEERLREEHGKLLAILDGMPVGVVIIGRDRIIRWANRATVAMAGLATAGELVGRHCGDYLCSAQQDACPVLDLGQRVDNSERILRRRDGIEIPIIKTVDEIAFDGTDCFIETFVDIADRKRMETELAQAQKLESVGRLAAGIAHEINTPIQFVSDNLTFLREACADLLGLCERHTELLAAAENGPVPAEQLAAQREAREEADVDYLAEDLPPAIEQSLEGANRVAEIVRSMKEFSHPGASEPAPADLNAAVAATVNVARNEWKYVAELTTELDPELPPVTCQIGEINQILLNLIINARDALAEQIGEGEDAKGEIHIATARDAGRAVITVADNGPGIPPGIRDKIFDPFFTTKEVGEGSGQGLSIARQVIVDKHHGELAVADRPGGGTVFTISLPLEATT